MVGCERLQMCDAVVSHSSCLEAECKCVRWRFEVEITFAGPKLITSEKSGEIRRLENRRLDLMTFSKESYLFSLPTLSTFLLSEPSVDIIFRTISPPSNSHRRHT